MRISGALQYAHAIALVVECLPWERLRDRGVLRALAHLGELARHPRLVYRIAEAMGETKENHDLVHGPFHPWFAETIEVLQRSDVAEALGAAWGWPDDLELRRVAEVMEEGRAQLHSRMRESGAAI